MCSENVLENVIKEVVSLLIKGDTGPFPAVGNLCSSVIIHVSVKIMYNY